MLSHPGETVLRNTAHAYGLKLKLNNEKCEDCATSKARQSNVSKGPVERESVIGKKLMIDISSVKSVSYGGAKFWLHIMDDASEFQWAKFLKKKNELSDKMITHINHLRGLGYDIRNIRCDRSGENEKFQRDAEKAGLGLIFEFTAPNTPQRNGQVERKFATLYGRIRSMLNVARFPKEMRGKLWAEAANTATKIDNILVRERDGKCPYEKFWKTEPTFARHLRVF